MPKIRKKGITNGKKSVTVDQKRITERDLDLGIETIGRKN